MAPNDGLLLGIEPALPGRWLSLSDTGFISDTGALAIAGCAQQACREPVLPGGSHCRGHAVTRAWRARRRWGLAVQTVLGLGLTGVLTLRALGADVEPQAAVLVLTIGLGLAAGILRVRADEAVRRL